MGKDEVGKFAVIHNHWNGSVRDLERIERLVNRFGVKRVEKALQNRENKFKNNGHDPLYDKWEKNRQFA